MKYAAEQSDVITKTSLMLGLGETDDELLDCMDDLRELVLTSHTRPVPAAYVEPPPVERFVTPDEFERYREWGLEKASKRWYQAPLYDRVTALSVFSNLITWVYKKARARVSKRKLLYITSVPGRRDLPPMSMRPSRC